MKISAIMSPHVHCLNPDTVLTDAAKRLRELDVGSMPVCEEGRLVGIVTDRDLTVRGLAEECSPALTPINEVMSTAVVHAYADQEVAAGIQLMEKHQVRRLPILDRREQVVGILALGDIATAKATTNAGGPTLRAISQPPPENSAAGVRLMPTS